MFLLAIEGIDGSGKTTLAQALREHMKGLYSEIMIMKDLDTTNVGGVVSTLIRHENLSPLVEMYLFLACKSELFNLIQNKAGSNILIILDRSFDSFRTYFSNKGVCTQLIEANLQAATYEILPDLSILLDVPAQTAMIRKLRENKNHSKFDKMPLEDYSTLRTKFLTLYLNRSLPPSHILDGTLSTEELINLIIPMIN